MRLLSLVVAYLLSSAVARAADAGTAVWIDTDPAIGPAWREVDDAFALLLAFRSPELRIVGISSTYGNAPLRRTTHVARDLVRRFGTPAVSEQKVFAGAASPRDRRETDATRALRDALQRERKLTYIALGPLTNLAVLFELYPEQARRIERVIILGGHKPGAELTFPPRRWPRIHDANVFKDPASAAIVLRRGRNITLAPFEAYTRLRVTRGDWNRMISGSAGDYLRPRTTAWIWFWTRIVRLDGAPPFDAVAVLAAARPHLVPSGTAYARMEDGTALVVDDHISAVRCASKKCRRCAREQLPCWSTGLWENRGVDSRTNLVVHAARARTARRRRDSAAHRSGRASGPNACPVRGRAAGSGYLPSTRCCYGSSARFPSPSDKLRLPSEAERSSI
jgi:pyrimidine-specific ribonucleoside hydrolase